MYQEKTNFFHQIIRIIPPMSLNEDLEKLFQTLAAIMDIRGENTFKAIAFSKVARVLSSTTADIRELVETDRLKEIEGIGPSSQKIIEDYVKTGKSSDFEEVAASVPPGLILLLGIPGLGPKTIAQCWKERNITCLEDLVKAIEQGKLAGLKGIGEKKIETIKQGIAMRESAGQRIGIVLATPVAKGLVQRLRELPLVRAAEFAGSLRRGKETIGDVDLVCAVKKESDGPKISEAFVKFPEVQRVLGQGTTKASIVTERGLQVDLRIVPEENFGATLLYFTGSKDHNVKLRGIALDKEMTLNEWGLYRLSEYDKAEKKSGAAPAARPVASKTEKEIYAALGLPYIVSELREDRGEIEAAEAGKLPKLIEQSDIRGDLHTHTNASDGQGTIEEMAQAALALGYEYLCITDHSKSSVIANGLSVERLLKHIQEIHRVSDKLKGITLLAGSEVDILVDGRLDFEDAILKELDFVVASPHVSLKQDAQKATDRILRAIENRYVNVIGHPTGRLIQKREGLPLNFSAVYKAAAQSGTALEINSSYPRLDLNDIQARGAIEAGVALTIDTDAHNTEGLADISYGIQVAKRAWVTAKDAMNTRSLAELKKWVKKKRGN